MPRMDLERLQQLIAASGKSANAISAQAGFGRDYVRDLLRGKVKEPSASKLILLARALHTTPEYLNGSSSVPEETFEEYERRHEPGADPILHLPVNFVLRPGFFDRNLEPREGMVLPAASFATGEPQWLELVQGDRPELGIADNTVLHVIQHKGEFRKDDLIVCEIYRDQGRLVSRTILKVVGDPHSNYIGLIPPIQDLGEPADQFISHMSPAEFIDGTNRFGVIPVGIVACEYRYHWPFVADIVRGLARNDR